MDQISTVDRVRRQMGYRGDNYLGRTRARQFFYAAARGANADAVRAAQGGGR